MIPAPVFSRRSLTSVGEISCIPSPSVPIITGGGREAPSPRFKPLRARSELRRLLRLYGFVDLLRPLVALLRPLLRLRLAGRFLFVSLARRLLARPLLRALDHRVGNHAGDEAD